MRAARLGLRVGLLAVWICVPAAASAAEGDLPAALLSDPLPRSTADRPDDVSGPQFHVLYVVPSDGDDRQFDRDGILSESVAVAESWLAGQTDGRTLQMDTFGGKLDVTFYRLAKTEAQIKALSGNSVVSELENEVDAAGLKWADKLNLVYYDGSSDLACGQAAKPPEFPGHTGALYLKAQPEGSDCFGSGFRMPGQEPDYWEFGALHEMLHTLGVAPSCAPHYYNHHVSDSTSDLMWGGVDQPWPALPNVLDVGHDDYYEAHITGCFDLADSTFLNHGKPMPAVSMSAHPAALSNDRQPQFSFSSERGASFWCLHDDGAWQRCQSPYRVGSPLSDGHHYLAVYAVDSIGQAGPLQDYSWDIDSVAPAVTISPSAGPAPGAETRERTVSFAYESSEPLDAGRGGHFTCSLDGAPFEPCANEAHYSGLGTGRHNFAVRATDNAGNTGAPAQRAWTILADQQPVHTTPPPASETPATNPPDQPAGNTPTGHATQPLAGDAVISASRTLRALTASSTGRIALPTIRIVCPPTSSRSCSASADVTTVRKVRVDHRRARKLHLAHTRLAIRAGGRATITLRLSRNALAVLKRLHRVSVQVVIAARSSTGRLKRKTLTITLNAPPRRPGRHHRTG